MTETDQHPPKRKRRRRSPLIIILDLLILALLLGGIYYLIRPKLSQRRQDQLTDQLMQAFDAGHATIYINPNEAIVEGGEDEMDVLTYDEIYEPTTTPEVGGPTNATSPTSAGQEPTDPNAQPTTSGTTAAPGVVRPSAAPAGEIQITAIGRIQLPKIAVDMPVAEGATIYSLRAAIGRYEPSAQLGQPGQSILLGHRSYTYGRRFNRLDEMAIGDEIIIDDRNYRYTYTVDKIDIVLPKELGRIFASRVEGSRVLLVTCTPVRIADHRLLVGGTLTKTESRNP